MVRSILFTPATRLARRAGSVERALATGADVVVLDLEDGVGPADKDAARRALGQVFSDADAGVRGQSGRLAVRMNGLDSADGVRDYAAALEWCWWPGMVVVPKVEAAWQVRQVARMVSVSGADASGGAVRLLLTLETARGLETAAESLAAAPALSVVGYGSADHCRETGAAAVAEGLVWARGRVVNAAAAYGLAALDGVWQDYRDLAGLRAEARLVKSLGFSGKIAIHPDQVAVINEVFTPSAADIATARALLAAAAAAGGGAFAFQGRMVDAPILAQAQRVVNTAQRVVDNAQQV